LELGAEPKLTLLWIKVNPKFTYIQNQLTKSN